MKKFFISSTFYDMHAERDIIQNIVQPAVNQKLNEQGEYVSFSDLRWGIDTISDTTKHKILDACFDEIDSCKPYFIVFIGGRYGWIPSNDLVAPYQDRFGTIDILNKSVTELEVLYALKLNTNEQNRCLFYFKDDADYGDEEGLKREEVIGRIRDLKHKIETIAPTQIRHYNSIVDTQTEEILANQLVSDICNIVSGEKTLSWQDRIANQMKVKFDTSLPGLSSQWLNGLKNESIDLAVLLFPECKVKESLIINFASQIKSHKRTNLINKLFGRDNKETNAIYVNVGATKEISETYELQRYLIFQICETCKFDIPSMENLSDVNLRILISDLLTRYAKTENELYIIISEYDKLIDAQNMKWLPDFIKNVTWIVSLSNQSIAESLPSSTHKKSIYGSNHLGIIPFEEQISAYEKWSNKTVTHQVKDAIKNLPYANDYLMMEVIFNRLMHIDGKDIPGGDTGKIPEYMEQYIKEAPNNNEAVRYFLGGDYHKFNADLCEFIFMCISFLNRGLTISDIEKLAQNIGLSWTELDIIRFINYESFLLTQYEDGRYAISSSALSSSLAKSYHQKFKFEYSATIYDYLHDIPDATPIKTDNFWFLCYQTNHFKEYLEYLNSLYKVRKDNTTLKAAFLPLFSNAEAIRWLLNSFKREELQYSSIGFIAELVSIVASYSPNLTEEFISATQNIDDISGDLTTVFRQHYTLALNKINNYDYNGFIEEFDACLELSEKQFKENPPQFIYLDEDVEHKYPIGSFQDMLETEYGFSFVEDMAALMSKYTDLPKEYQDEEKASYYADKANEIRTRLSKVSYILPKDVWEIKKRNAESVKRKKPSLLRGKAIELSKQADRTENIDSKIKLLKESIGILDEILAIPEDDLVGEFRDSQKTIEYESTIYHECHRDIALCYDRLSDVQDGEERFISLDEAFKHLMIYSKEHHNEQSLNDIFRITRALIPIAPQNADESKCLQYCISGYVAFAETTPRTKTLSFEERLFAELSEDYFQKEIKRITSHNDRLRSQWIQECKNHINSFQSLGNIDAMIWMLYGLNRSFSYYVHELNLHEYDSVHIALMGSMLQKLEKYLHVAIFNSIHENAKKYLDKVLLEEDTLSVLYIEKMYSQYMLMQGEFDKSLEASQGVIDYCEENSLKINSSKINDVEYQARKLNSGVYLERNDIGKAWASIDKIADYAEKMYEQKQNLENLTELANTKLNQVILWDKMSVEPGLDLWTIEHHKGYDAQKQLSDTYMLCYNFEDKDEQLSKLMRRIRQSHEIIREKGLGYLATPKTLNLVKHFKGINNNAVQLEKEGKHDECVKQFTKLTKALKNMHFVDIYFEADWYAGVLFTLGQNSWTKGLKEQTEKYYKEATQIRYELDAEGISQNKENFALLLYFYALVILSKQLSQDLISHVIDLLNKSQKIFEDIENRLGPDSLSYYSSCCFNLGQIICLYTTGGNEVGLPFVESAINIMERLVNNYGLTKYQKDVEQFRRQYVALKNRK